MDILTLGDRLMRKSIMCGLWLVVLCLWVKGAEEAKPLRMAAFNVDATPPIGSPVAYAKTLKILDPLSARGVVLLSHEKPVVLCAVDWIGISNAGHDEWRAKLAEAAGTTPDRVAVHALHQHDGPRCDFTTESMLAKRGLGGEFYDNAFARRIMKRVADAIRAGIAKARPVTHIGTGKAKVEKVASNRRILGEDGKVAVIRWSKSKDPEAIAAPEGLIDPYVHLLSFYDGETPLAVLTYYATHPQSYYGIGEVSCDFVGLARNARQKMLPGATHIHFNGAGADVVAGKYNDGSEKMRPILAARLAEGMRKAWLAVKKVPVCAQDLAWRCQPVKLPPATNLDLDELRKTLDNAEADPRKRMVAANHLAWFERNSAGRGIDISCLQLGPASILHFPGELFIEYQLAAQQCLPGKPVFVAAYGDYGPGYIGTTVSYEQGGYETKPGVSLVAPEVEPQLIGVIRTLLKVPDVSVETKVGHMPKLPVMINALYRGNRKGPKVRVIWPSPEDNRNVLKPGTYTVTGFVPGTDIKPKAVVTVKQDIGAEAHPELKLASFRLGQVVLNQNTHMQDTPFIRNRDKFIRGLATSNPDRFLYMFRDAFGQKQPEGARPLGGWDSQTTKLRGHASGHYLSAIAQACAGATHDKALRDRFLTKMNYLINTLHDLSQKSGKPAREGGACHADPATVPPGPGKTEYHSDLTKEGIRRDYWHWGEGFISAYPPDQFIMLEKGATYGGKANQIWAPYYTLHKILAGLLDCYEVGGNEKALQVARDMGLWVYKRLSLVPKATRIKMWNRYIAGEYGGMNEVMARLFRLTKEESFLKCAVLFDNIDFFFGNAECAHGLACNVDTLGGKHANQHIPQITGALETYKAVKELRYYRVAENFWDICTRSYMYSIGGVAGAKNPKNSECFTARPDTLFANGFNKGGQNETCATYNLLKLSRQLFMFQPGGKYMDYYERALYNHILASVAEDNPGNTYHVPLNPGARKHFGNAGMDGFSCCNGTALESSTKLQDSIYFKSADDKALYVNLFVPSTLTWAARNMVLKQSTDFPYADTTRLTITGEGEFALNIRVPGWAGRGFFVRINGKEQAVSAKPGSYLCLRRTWKNKDAIDIRMPLHFYLVPLMDKPSIVSIFYGPVLLAAEEAGPRTDWRRVTLDADDIGKSITGDPRTLRFQVGDTLLKPFYETYGRHSVYVNVTLK